MNRREFLQATFFGITSALTARFGISSAMHAKELRDLDHEIIRTENRIGNLYSTKPSSDPVKKQEIIQEIEESETLVQSLNDMHQQKGGYHSQENFENIALLTGAVSLYSGSKAIEIFTNSLNPISREQKSNQK